MSRALRDVLADELARNDACGTGPVSRGEYLADADALIRIVREHDAQATAAAEAAANPGGSR